MLFLKINQTSQIKPTMRFTFLTLLLSFATLCVFASNNELFNYDKVKLESAITDLNYLEKLVNENGQCNSAELLKNGTIDQQTFQNFNNPFGINGEPPLGIPSFFWGCIFGVVGMVIVVIMTDKDKAELTKALYGCITTYAIIGLFYLLLLAEFGVA